MSKFQTIVRLRPLLPHEQSLSEALIVVGRQVKVGLDAQAKTYTFDEVFNEHTTQGNVYEALNVKHKIDLFNQGYSQTIFAYGQTGSGKTHTMEGTHHEPGIIPSIIQQLFSQPADQDHHYEIQVSFLQIHNEKVLDMLNFKKDGGAGLKLRYSHQEFHVENLTTITCSTPTQMMNCYARGCKSKIMAAHTLNDSSSRSHCIFTVRLTKTNLLTQESVVSHFHLVDLAGSERVHQTKAQGLQFHECTEINKSLFALRQVISQLAQVKQHISYRDSKLTSILKNSLQGNSYVLMV